MKLGRAGEICRVELVSEIRSAVAHADVRTFRTDNANGSKCDVVIHGAASKRIAYCIQHERNNDCEGAARVCCALDLASLESLDHESAPIGAGV
jgi:hypothetical protein